MRLLLLALALAASAALPAAALRAAEMPATDLPDKAEVSGYAEQLLAETYPADGPGAAVLVARGDEVLFRGARGVADIASGTPLGADDLFRIGSVTKQFAAAGLLTLVEAGKVALDDPLSKYLPDYPAGDRITVLELLNHTSGVSSDTDIPGRRDAPIRQDMNTAQLVDGFKNETPDFAPGQDWAYSNSGYVLVGAVIEAASGMPWHAYLQQALFAPLGLDHTRYGADPDAIALQVHGYTLADAKPVPPRAISMTQPHAAGALLSTVDDLLKWNRALHEGKVLQSASYQQMITPVGKAQAQHYGFGIQHETLRNQDLLDHGGGIDGFLSYLMYLSGSGTTVAVLQNSDAVADGKDGPRPLARKLAAFAIGDPYPVPVPIAVDAASLRALEGVYRIDDKTTRVLRMVDGKLTAQRSGGTPWELIPTGVDEFVYQGGFDRLQIQRDAAGAVTGMRFFADGEGDGDVVPRSPEPLPGARRAIALPRAALERVVGTYMVDGKELKVFLDGEQLKTQLAGQPALDLFAESPNRFFLTAVDATLEFSPGDGMAEATTLHQGAAKIEFRRKP